MQHLTTHRDHALPTTASAIGAASPSAAASAASSAACNASCSAFHFASTSSMSACAAALVEGWDSMPPNSPFPDNARSFGSMSGTASHSISKLEGEAGTQAQAMSGGHYTVHGSALRVP